MNINSDGTTVSFKTEDNELFEAEKSGAKSNTVRILDPDEWGQLIKHDPKKIIIQHKQEAFLRTLTNVHAAGSLLGKALFIFSWTQKGEHDHTDHMQPYHEQNTENIGDAQKHIPRDGYDVNGRDSKKVGGPLTDLVCYNCGEYLTMETLRDFYCRGCLAKYRIDNEGVFYRV